jgi:prevent-host-death family protein
MVSVGMQEAKRNFSKLIAAVEAGEVVILKRYGKPVARLVRFEQPKEAPRAETRAARNDMEFADALDVGNSSC